MRTSHLQTVIMVEFMERNGDLSKPTGGPRGRHFIQMKWKELTEKLNSEGTGDSRSEEKWRKVWSDLKNNTKKKFAKINKAASGTGGGPALQLSMTDIENRIMQIIGVQAATGMAVLEAGFQQGEETSHTYNEETNISGILLEETTGMEEDWNTPGTSSQPTVAPPVHNTSAGADPPATVPIVIDSEEQWRPPQPKRKRKEMKDDDVAKLFVESDKNAREYARERDVAYERLETERLRLREYELRERVRQRDQELHLQAQWLEFMKGAMDVIIKYLESKNK